MNSPNVYDSPSFLTFLKTGELGQITFETRVEDIYRLLGDPDYIRRPFDYIKDNDTKSYLLLYYGSLTIACNNSMIESIEIDFQKNGSIPIVLNIKWYLQVRNMSYDEFISFVMREGIRCQRIIGTPNYRFDPKTEDYWLYIERGKKKTEYGVEKVGLEIVFDLESHLIRKITSSDSEILGNRVVEDC